MEVAVAEAERRDARRRDRRPFRPPLAGAARSFTNSTWAQGREKQQLIIQTSQRQAPRSNGQWGKRKPLKLRPGQLDDIEGDDRRILAYLAGGAPERTTWMPTQADPFKPAAHGAMRSLSHSLAEVLLPLMCGTGRGRRAGATTVRSRGRWQSGTTALPGNCASSEVLRVPRGRLNKTGACRSRLAPGSTIRCRSTTPGWSFPEVS